MRFAVLMVAVFGSAVAWAGVSPDGKKEGEPKQTERFDLDGKGHRTKRALDGNSRKENALRATFGDHWTLQRGDRVHDRTPVPGIDQVDTVEARRYELTYAGLPVAHVDLLLTRTQIGRSVTTDNTLTVTAIEALDTDMFAGLKDRLMESVGAKPAPRYRRAPLEIVRPSTRKETVPEGKRERRKSTSHVH